MKHLAGNWQHLESTHDRWIKHRVRNGIGGYTEEEIHSQCMLCAFYIPLAGVFKEDWGVCSNFKSPYDRQAMFEHDGCMEYQESDDFFQF